jgi:putative glycosyltransferase
MTSEGKIAAAPGARVPQSAPPQTVAVRAPDEAAGAGPDLSIVTTLYRSAETLVEFHRRISEVASGIAADWELILVNDGSPDESLRIALDLHRADPRVRVVDLSRNFGHHRAIVAGLSYARGRRTFLIDCDLEEPPECLLDLVRAMETSGCDVAFGVQAARRGALAERITGAAFYWLTRNLAGLALPRNLITARLMTRRFVRQMLRVRDQNPLLSLMTDAAGFAQVPVVVDKRSSSTTTYSLARRFAIAAMVLATASTRPLYLAMALGAAITLLACLGIVYVIVRLAITGEALAGWTSLIVSVWFFGGVLTFLVGLVGVYVGEAYLEARRRPRFIVRALHETARRESECA